MAYEIVMPQLSDSMDEGKLISWKVKPGDHVKKGDVIAEVESDKAVMEVQTFRDGTVGQLKVSEGESVPVGTPIATIDTEGGAHTQEVSQPSHADAAPAPQSPPERPTPAPEPEPAKAPETAQKHPKPEPAAPSQPSTAHSILDEILGMDEEHDTQAPPMAEGAASPRARALAARYGIDIAALQETGKLPRPAHEEDIRSYQLARYFTPKALKLLDLYRLDPALFPEKHKHTSDDILAYVAAHDIPLPQPLTPFQKALIHTVEHAAQKPVYHLADTLDISVLLQHKHYSVTVSLIQLFARAMMAYAPLRSVIKGESIVTWPNASISLAVAHASYLYMPVFRDANRMTGAQIHDLLADYEAKAGEGRMTPQDMEGSTFGISNLGMLGVERFDAMINRDDSAIAAIGAAKENRISVTLTLDHRVVNGYQAAQFMQSLKTMALDPMTYKE